MFVKLRRLSKKHGKKSRKAIMGTTMGTVIGTWAEIMGKNNGQK